MLAQQLSVPSPGRAHHIQPQRRGSISISQRFHSIFTPGLGIPPQAQERLFLCASISPCYSDYCLIRLSAFWAYTGRRWGIFTTRVTMCWYQGGTAVTYAVLAKSSGMFYAINPSPVPEEGNYFFCVCINI